MVSLRVVGDIVRKLMVWAVAVGVSIGAASCSSKEESGALIGAVTGALLGNQIGDSTGRILATAAGAVIGGIIGSEIGRKLDEADRKRAAAAEYYALEEKPVGSPIRWRNPESGHHGEVVARREYRKDGKLCRDFKHTIYIEGEPDTLSGTSCKGEDGRWRSTG